MNKKPIEVTVAGGCPKCGSLDVHVPNDYTPETLVKCRTCEHEDKHKDFFQNFWSSRDLL